MNYTGLRAVGGSSIKNSLIKHLQQNILGTLSLNFTGVVFFFASGLLGEFQNSCEASDPLTSKHDFTVRASNAQAGDCSRNLNQIVAMRVRESVRARVGGREESE